MKKKSGREKSGTCCLELDGRKSKLLRQRHCPVDANAISSMHCHFKAPSMPISSQLPTLRPRVYAILDPNFRSFFSMSFSDSLIDRRRFPSFSSPPSTANSEIAHKNGHVRPNSSKLSNFRVRASNGDFGVPSSAKLAVFSAAIAAALAVANRVLYKLALVPMKEYPFFLAQFTTFGYVVIYFTILFLRYKVGIVTDDMLALPKSRFIAIGVLEALGVVLGMTSGAMLPGPAIPILSQTFLVWQLVFSAILLRRRYSFNQIVGCLVVTAGVVVAVAGGTKSNAGQMLSEVEILWPALMIASSAFQAGASIVKEFIFIDAANRFKGKSLDIFVVNSMGSGFQALFVLLFLPFLSNLKGIPFTELPSYLKSGAGCLFNIGANNPGCVGAPLLPLLYISTNLAFNIFLLNVVKLSSALVASLAVMLSVPISIYILSLPLPYLPDATNLSPTFISGSAILLLGLILYYIPQTAKKSS